MKLIAILLIIISFCSCATIGQISGKYAAANNPDCFQLKNDSTFIYEYRAFHAYEYSTGIWKKTGKNTISLSSGIQNILIPIKITEVNKNSVNWKKNLDIEISPIGELPISNYECSVYINDSLYVTKRCDSLKVLKIEKPINEIYFKLFQTPLVATSTLFPLNPLVSERVNIKNEKDLIINIVFEDSLFGYKVFNKEEFVVIRNGLKRFNVNTQKWRTMPKVSDEKSIFIRH